MAVQRFWWIDDSDYDDAQSRLRDVRSTRLSSWDWSRWDEGDYPSEDEAFEDLFRRIGTAPMFADGKVVYTYGIPKCHSRIAAALDRIPEKVLFILVARPDTRLTLYKGAVKMDMAKVDAPLKFQSGSDVAVWVKQKAAKLGVEIDELAIKMLIDAVGSNPSRLSSEIKKLKHLTNDGKIHPGIVVEGASGAGEGDVMAFCTSIEEKNFQDAEIILGRMLARGESPMKICGFMDQWVQKMAIADACDGDYDSIKEDVAKLRKYKKKKEIDEIMDKISRLRQSLEAVKDPTKNASILNEIEQLKKELKHDSPPMYAKPGALFFACKAYKALGFRKYWAYFILLSFGKLQIQLRKGGKDPCRLMYQFLWKLKILEEEIINGGTERWEIY